ncbi:unnamed protein product [Pseudo-nitzschia multistriata]|uniref:Uncharacterized protein n=1 Tax=Pseudo-nitzschia multistriata TaxID=183589 RepID=A0A448YVP1_9STRA|nr:unnamed protein product [Pseudo-nitzschia multistriata]
MLVAELMMALVEQGAFCLAESIINGTALGVRRSDTELILGFLALLLLLLSFLLFAIPDPVRKSFLSMPRMSIE